MVLGERLTILNAFVHDTATGTWIASLALATSLRSQLAACPGVPIAPTLMTLTWVSLGVILLTGVFRMVTWRVFGWTGDMAADRIKLLKIKHALLGIVFVAGTAWQAAITYSS